ncbi:hypothetical protein KAR91_34230 [Candidatus Pacearchaeota archaeon]|nr:hypothetical protein [Candidatus Pacearchaeota archaeon]
MSEFLNEDEIVDDIISKMDTEAKKSWTDVKEEDLVMGHHTIGMAIRNDYLLWDENNPYTRPADGSDDYLVENNIVTDYNFPDQVSQRIIEKIWQKLKNN